ncbi:hypothetical protein O0S10_10205 [Methanocorpusculum sp. MG]|uniref:Uncharacterized protein n=1 Tax=Methanocorpusculum petauri TaxID=3002863 RepID=A0ABT4IIM1_9EURY|nr:hypothetical protein [Methanocorpusculum petauri]MCZ0861584.1 hypothetical protein [Methanocorpusculum petauri]
MCRDSLPCPAWEVLRVPVVRRAAVQDALPLLPAVVSAGIRGNIRASEALFVRERENLLGTSASGRYASHRSGCAGFGADGVPQGVCGVSRSMIDCMVLVLFECVPAVVAAGVHLRQLREDCFCAGGTSGKKQGI